MVFIKFYILAVVLSNRIHRRLNQCCNRTAVRAVGVKQGDGSADEGTGCRVIAVCFFLCLGKESGDGCLVCRHIRCNERGSALKERKNLIPGAALCCRSICDYGFSICRRLGSCCFGLGLGLRCAFCLRSFCRLGLRLGCLRHGNGFCPFRIAVDADYLCSINCEKFARIAVILFGYEVISAVGKAVIVITAQDFISMPVNQGGGSVNAADYEEQAVCLAVGPVGIRAGFGSVRCNDGVGAIRPFL